MYSVRYISSNLLNLKIPSQIGLYLTSRSTYKFFRLHYSQVLKYNTSLTVNNVSLDKYIWKLQDEYVDLLQNENFASNHRYIELKPIISILDEKKLICDNISSLKELIESDDKDVSDLAKEEKNEFDAKLKELDEDLLEALFPIEKQDLCESVVLEIQAGVGGQEAMLFAQELFNMYCNFISQKGWKYELAEYLETDLGGLRRTAIIVSGPEVFKFFKHEAGVHRVQRTPVTEKSGRIHTSTVSVVVLPQPSEIEVNIEKKDLKIETKRSTGAGGQHVNTTDSAVRITHVPTNITVECQVDRSQIKNRKLALARLSALLYQQELDNQIANTQATRKSQVKSSNRNEKIRTYNYNQDRITDHRLNGIHFHNMVEFMQGGSELEDMMEKLNKQANLKQLLQLVENVDK